MRHKYETRGIVLARAPAGEANALITILTLELGIVRARAQGARAPGAKLAAALATFAESELVLVRGREVWRVAGAVLEKNWFKRIPRAARERAARVVGLLLRLAAGEASDAKMFPIVRGFFEALAVLPKKTHDATEILAALRLLAALGLDAGTIPGGTHDFNPSTLAAIAADRASFVTRINRGIKASGL